VILGNFPQRCQSRSGHADCFCLWYARTSCGRCGVFPLQFGIGARLDKMSFAVLSAAGSAGSMLAKEARLERGLQGG
jgi:hypothetical protein